jgi:tetratricopeptide (TPR) repeat protein
VLVAFPGVPKPVEWAAEMMPLRLADAFLKMISAVAEDSPLVVVVDDVHAADGASVGVLHNVARKLGSKMLLFLLAARTHELRTSVSSTAFLSDSLLNIVDTMQVDPLSEPSAQTLVRMLEAGSESKLSNGTARRVLLAAAGNPLALELLVSEWRQNGAASLLGDLDRLNTLPPARLGIPRAIQAVFDRQVPRLDRPTRAVLDLAAVLGRRCADLSLYEVVGLPIREAVQALARLCDQGLMREVHGELEFRNELLRAQAYYAIGAVGRKSLHLLTAQALCRAAARPGENREIEIAWHFLRAGDCDQAAKYVTLGARNGIASGAPFEAQRVLEAFASMIGGIHELPPGDRILLARSMIQQSKAQEVLPAIEGLLSSTEISPEDRALVAGIAASAEHLLNRDTGVRYGAAADKALLLARESHNHELVARALFESARAGAESGDEKRIAKARVEITSLLEDGAAAAIPVAHYARGFCEYYSHYPKTAVSALQYARKLLGGEIDQAELSRILTGLAVCEVDLCHFDAAFSSFTQALQLAERIGDDSRASIISANLCMLELARGRFPDAVERGNQSLDHARASGTQPMLSQSYLNLCEAYLMVGDLRKAAECQDKARQWLGSQRNWKANVEFLCQAAYGALLRGNIHEALESMVTVERLAQGRQLAIAPPVGIRLLELFRLAHVSGPGVALNEAREMYKTYRDRHPLLFLDAVAAVAWLEQWHEGRLKESTREDLRLFDELGAVGRKMQLIQEGFIQPSH